MQECINENWAKSVKVSMRKYRGKLSDSERLIITVERRG